MSKRAEEYNKEFDSMYGDHIPDLPASKAEQRALETYPITVVQRRYDGIAISDDYYDSNRRDRHCFQEGYEQAEKDLGWHSVDESLPPMDEEVIVLLNEWNEVRIEPLYRIAFGHIVNKEYCEDFSGWNIPGVSYWMPMPEIPKEEKK